ncbi:hypothetical protein [Vibrio owensii]|uniref:hypothetical protein n=1 Tax=Vibrio harveyi group TaxID=717610 RepID=UPI003CC56DBD
MKKAILAALMLGCLSTNASAKSSDYELTIDGYTISELKYMYGNCGDYRQVGVSSIFGGPEEYNNPYPELGWFSAKLDRVRSIPGHIRSDFNGQFSKAHETQYNLYYSMAQMEYRFDMTKPLLDGHDATLNYNMQKMQESMDEANKYIAYNTEKTINDVSELLRSPKNGYRPENGQEYEDNGWTDYQTCMEWWQYQEAHPNGEYLRYINL